MYMCAAALPAVEVILAAPGKVPKEEKLFVEKATFGKASTHCVTPCGTPCQHTAHSTAQHLLVLYYLSKEHVHTATRLRGRGSRGCGPAQRLV